MLHDASCDARGCCDLIVFQMQSDGVDEIPVADGTTPAFGRAVARAEVHGTTREEQRGIAPCVPVLGRDKPNRAVQLLRVVPAHKGLDPCARGES